MNLFIYSMLYCVVAIAIITIGSRFTPREHANNPNKFTEFGKNRTTAIGILLLLLLPEAYKAWIGLHSFDLAMADVLKQIVTAACGGLAGAYMAKGYQSPPIKGQQKVDNSEGGEK